MLAWLSGWQIDERLKPMSDQVSQTKPSVTHFKYVCRVCLEETLQPVVQEAPETTPIPICCGRQRDMAYKGIVCTSQD